MEDDSTLGKIIGIAGKVILGMFAVGTAAAFATAFYAGKAGREARGALDESMSQMKEKVQGTMDSLAGPAPTPTV